MQGTLVYYDHSGRRVNTNHAGKKRRRNDSNAAAAPGVDIKYEVVFQPLDKDEQSFMILSLPQSLLNIALCAVQNELCVTINLEHCHQLKFAPHTKASISSASQQTIQYTYIKVQDERGLYIPVAEHNKHNRVSSTPLTLFPNLPTADDIPRLKSKRVSFNFTIVACSPIITVDPSNPYCLVEATDSSDDNSGSTCTILLMNDALLCHFALQPGYSYTVIDAKLTRWNISQSINDQYLASLAKWRVSPFCYMVTQVKQISACHVKDTIPLAITDSSLGCVRQNNTITLYGTVTDVKWTTNVYLVDDEIKSEHRIDYIKLQREEDVENSILLFLACYPMSRSQQLSVKIGSAIKISNASKIAQAKDTFYATLRSTLCFYSFDTVKEVEDDAQDLSSSYSFPHCSPYPELWWQYRLEPWYKSHAVNSHMRTHDISNLVRTLMSSSRVPSGDDASRCVYSEFFELEELKSQAQAIRMLQQSLNAEPQQCSENEKMIEPDNVTSLASIRNKCIGDIQKRIVGYTSDNTTAASIEPGWSATAVLYQDDLSSSSDESHSIFVGGDVTIDEVETVVSGSISDGINTLPFQLSQSASEKYRTGCRCVMLELDQVVISCVCIHREQSIKHDSETTNVADLFRSMSNTEENCGCVALYVRGCIFLTSILLYCTDCINICDCETETDASITQPSNEHGKYKTLQQFLSGQVASTDTCVALLASKNFKVSTCKGGKFSGLTTRLSHIPIDCLTGSRNVSTENIVTIQSMDAKPVGILHETATFCLRSVLNDSFSVNMSDESIYLATAWWKLASESRHCAILGGAWDNYSMGSESIRPTLGVAVLFTSSAREIDYKRGFVRFRYNLFKLRAIVFPVSSHSLGRTATRTRNSHAMFAYVTQRRLPGSVGLCFERRIKMLGKKNKVAVGEMMWQSSVSGAVVCKLADLMKLICNDLRDSTRLNLNPSLVRVIRNAVFLEVLYCQAIAECTCCFSKLTRTIESFPTLTDYSKTSTPLACPKGCSVQEYGVIRWECSGILDDGTAQAKLYADRETVLCLLGIDKRAVRRIESGAWLTSKGIMYMKANPPSIALRKTVENLQSAIEWNRAATNAKTLVIPEEAKIYKWIDPVSLAEYELHKHCRYSRMPSRQLSYYVLCKPISDNMRRLNSATITVASVTKTRGDDDQQEQQPDAISSYTLPPLKLQLVDCCCTLFESDT